MINAAASMVSSRIIRRIRGAMALPVNVANPDAPTAAAKSAVPLSNVRKPEREVEEGEPHVGA